VKDRVVLLEIMDMNKVFNIYHIHTSILASWCVVT